MESRLVVVEIAEDAREQAEEGLLGEGHAHILLMHVGEDNHNNGEDFVKVVNLGSNGIAVVLDHVDEKSREGVHRLEGIGDVTVANEGVVDGHTGLDAYAVEE